MSWKIDRHIPLALIIAMVIQTASMIWYVAKLDDRVGQLEKQAAPMVSLSERLIKLETRFESANDKLVEIRDLIKHGTRVAATTKR